MKQRCVIFGVGFNYHRFKEYIEWQFEVVALVDNAWKKYPRGIVSPETIDDITYDVIVVTPNKYEEIYQQLREMGVAANRIRILVLMRMENEHKKKILGNNFYGQHAEDLILSAIFTRIGIEKPSYIDLGANHPTLCSNTAFLYEHGCRGINIEPNPALIRLFELVRPDDKNLNIGCAVKENVLPYYVFDEASGRNTFSKEVAESYVNETGCSIKKVLELPVVTLEKIIKDYCPDGFPDFLDCDIEGMDYDVLMNYDLKSNGPKVICVEVYFYEIEKWDVMMDSKGYFRFCRIGANNIYVKKCYSFELRYIKMKNMIT